MNCETCKNLASCIMHPAMEFKRGRGPVPATPVPIKAQTVTTTPTAFNPWGTTPEVDAELKAMERLEDNKLLPKHAVEVEVEPEIKRATVEVEDYYAEPLVATDERPLTEVLK